jgi:hypothetical protein
VRAAFLCFCLSVCGCGLVMSAVEYPELKHRAEMRKQLPPPAELVDPAHVIGGRYRAFIKSDGRPNKQIMQLRHGKKFLLEGITLIDGWNDHGQQKVAGQGYVKSQHVGTVIYDGCKFGRWTAGKKLWDRQPGVDKIILAGGCRDPDGKLLKNGERWN